jgi:uncharacterized phage protein gp47/JayE
MYENQTFEVIVQRMLNEISDEIDKREGSIAYDMLAPKANELAIYYTELNNVLNFGFAETTYGEYLDKKVGEVGIIRLSALKAIGSITFISDEEDLVIPMGSVVYTDSGIRFSTDSEVSINNGSATVTITAIEGGNTGNVPANSIINNEISGLTCYNLESTKGGADSESDNDLFNRYITKVRKPASSGNVYHYEMWANEIVGIGDARIIPIWSGGGTVKVIIISDERGPVTVNKVTEVYNHIESQRPVGVEVTVESALAKNVNISASLTLKDGEALEEIRPKLEDELEEYFKSIAFKESDIKYSRIGNIILSIDGVIDYTSLLVNNGTSNIILQQNEVPLLGTVGLAI